MLNEEKNVVYEFTPDEYDEYLDRYSNGKISFEEWTSYCTGFLMYLMIDNRDVLERLK